MAAFAAVRHKRAARMLGYALTAKSPAVWHDLSIVLLVRLTGLERAALAFAALRTLEPEDREFVVNATHSLQQEGSTT